MKRVNLTSLAFTIIVPAILSSCSGRIQHEYVSEEGWYHRRPNVGTGRGHYHRERTPSKFSWEKDTPAEAGKSSEDKAD